MTLFSVLVCGFILGLIGLRMTLTGNPGNRAQTSDNYQMTYMGILGGSGLLAAGSLITLFVLYPISTMLVVIVLFIIWCAFHGMVDFF